MSALSERLGEAKGADSIDEIVARANRHGRRIDRSVVARYLRGEHGPRPRQETLTSLAAGFGLDVRELRELAGRPAGELGPYVPTAEAASLSADQRAALDQLIRAITRDPRRRSALGDADRGDPAERTASVSDLTSRVDQDRVASRRSVRPRGEDTDED